MNAPMKAQSAGPSPSRPAFGGRPRMTGGEWCAAKLTLQHFDLRSGAGAQERQIAADGEEAHAALGAGDGAFGVEAVEPCDLAGLAAGRDDLVERGFDRRRVRI